MAIIKPGFTPGFRGRTQPSSWNRRAHYLAREEGRESAHLRDMTGREIDPGQAVETLGGPRGAYHEIIVAPSQAECAAIRTRQPEDPDRAAADTGDRIAKTYAQGRPYVLAIHGQADRFHYHLAVAGPMSERALGKQGQVQKAWNRELFGDEPRIQDWEAHLRFKDEKARLQEVLREQRENDCRRREAVRRAAPGQKAAVARPFEAQARNLIERRYALEGRAIQARYEARGALDSARRGEPGDAGTGPDRPHADGGPVRAPAGRGGPEGILAGIHGGSRGRRTLLRADRPGHQGTKGKA